MCWCEKNSKLKEQNAKLPAGSIGQFKVENCGNETFLHFKLSVGPKFGQF